MLPVLIARFWVVCYNAEGGLDYPLLQGEKRFWVMDEKEKIDSEMGDSLKRHW